MATIISGNTIKLNNGQTIQAQEGGWYDGQQLFGGTLSAPGVINAKSPQQGAGQAVSKEVVQQTNPANWQYIQQQQQVYKPSGGSQPVPTSTPSGTPSGTSGGGAGVGITPQPTLDLPKLYESLYASSGIRDAEADLLAKQNAYNAQVSKIKDNPYLSEATMTGRIKKLSEKFDADANSVRNDIATAKADAETRINLQLKQMDINSQQAQQALQQFNTLLSMGALDGASGEDIANITRSTGLGSSLIYSAIEANKAKNAVKPQMISYDDGQTQGFIMIDPYTGEILNRQAVASSKPSGGGKLSQNEITSSAISVMTPAIVNSLNDYGHISPQDWQQAKASWLAQGLPLDVFLNSFAGYADINRGDFESAYGFTNPNPQWRGDKKVGSYDEYGNIIK